MDIDLSTPLAQLLGISVVQLGTYLLMILAAAPIISALRPRVEPVLIRWREAALLTRTTADDTGVRVLAGAWGVVVWLPETALKVVPVFTSAVEQAREQRKTSR